MATLSESIRQMARDAMDSEVPEGSVPMSDVLREGLIFQDESGAVFEVQSKLEPYDEEFDIPKDSLTDIWQVKLLKEGKGENFLESESEFKRPMDVGDEIFVLEMQFPRFVKQLNKENLPGDKL